MRIVLHVDSPIPLYHQIAEAVSYRIATGRLSAGEHLPSVRRAAAQWGVNLNTVRRAYAELVKRGLVRMDRARGTQVLGGAGSEAERGGQRKTDRFAERVLREAQDRHGLGREALLHLLANWSPSTADAGEVVHVVECSEAQCQDHVDEIQSRWAVEARPWCLSNEGEPPAGPVVATYFHYNEVRRRWPHRLHEIHFAAIRPDPTLPASVGGGAPAGRRRALTLCEFEEAMAQNMVSDLSVLFPVERYSIKPLVVHRAKVSLDCPSGRGPLLVSPRVWGKLSSVERDDPRVVKVRYVFGEEVLEELAEQFGWRRRR